MHLSEDKLMKKRRRNEKHMFSNEIKSNSAELSTNYLFDFPAAETVLKYN